MRLGECDSAADMRQLKPWPQKSFRGSKLLRNSSHRTLPKMLTLRLSSCDTISANEVTMGRLNRRGSASFWTRFPVCFASHNRSFTASAVRATAALALCLCAAIAFAQLPGQDVHVQPRIDPHKKEAPVDVSLKNHDQPIKVGVNLVLVPVTI